MPIYAKLGDGSVKGGATAKNHEGWFEVRGFDFGQGALSDARGGFGSSDADEGEEDADEASPLAAALKQRIDAMRKADKRLRGDYEIFSSTANFTKAVDSVSHEIMDWSSQGDARRLQFDLCMPGGPVLLTVIFKLARVTNYSYVGPSPLTLGNAIETTTINWEQLEIHTYEMGADGSIRGPFSFTWTKPAAPPARSLVSDSGWNSFFGDGVGGGGSAAAFLASDDAVLGLDSQIDQSPALAAPDSSGYEQLNRKLVVDNIGSAEFALESFTGDEGMSQLFKFKLTLVASATIDPKSVIGKEVKFAIEDDDGMDSAKAGPPRRFHGIVRRLRAAEAGSGDARRFEAVVVPSLWKLTKRSDCRIFQNKKVSEIVKFVCTEAGLPASYVDTSGLGDADLTLDYCVQYRESDYDFVVRLLETQGIFFFFRHEASKHTWVLAAKTTAYQDCDPAQVVLASGVADDKHVSKWSCAWEIVSKKAILGSRDVAKANAQAGLTSERANNLGLSDTDKLELYDYSGKYVKSADGTKLATAAIEAEEATHEVGSGESSCDQFGVGLKFRFKSDEGQSDAQSPYAIVKLHHSAEARLDATGASVAYTNRFTAIPATRVFRPRRRRERPFIIGPQTAIVVAPDGEEIHTDEFGRVKVRFHWDRAPNVKPEERSCWIRVAQALAGKGWGMVALPRKDQEVVVEFIDGDPDRPLITGSVYNGENKPRDLPAMKTQTLLRTRSSKEGTAETFNEVRFEDKKGDEHVFVHAEKDFERIVKHDDKLTVGKDDEGSRTVVINKDSTLTVNKGHRLETIKEGNDTLTIEKGDRTIEVKAGKETVTIKGDRTVTIQSGAETLEVTTGDQTIKVGGKTAIDSTKGFAVKSTGGKITLESSQAIELKAGASKIKIGAAGIVIEGPTVKVEGKMEAKIKSVMVSAEASGVMTVKGSLTKIG